MLLDDDFSSIVAAVRLGRRIFDNLKKAVAYIFAVHTPIIGLTLIPLVLRWPLIFSPVHVVFLELIIDPACSVVFEAEPEEKDVMNRRPRAAKEPLFGRKVLGHQRAPGTGGAGDPGRDLRDLPGPGTDRRPGPGADLHRADRREPGPHPDEPVVEPGDRRDAADPQHRAVVGAGRGRRRSWGSSSTCPRSEHLFRFGVLHPVDLVICLGAGLLSVAWFEAFKAIRARRERSAGGLAPSDG